MRVYTDWCCRLLPMMRDLIASPEDACSALAVLERAGIHRFCMMPDFDAALESVPMFLLRRNKAMRELKALLPPKSRVDAAACVCLSKGVHQTRGLSKLCIPKTNYLPIRLPLMPEPDWLAVEINRFLYHSNDRVLFMNFDLYPIFYPDEMLEKLLRIPNAAYQFNYRSLTDPHIREYLKLLLKRNAPILFGTSVNSPGKAAYYEFDYAIQVAQAHFSEFERDALFFHKKLYRKPN